MERGTGASDPAPVAARQCAALARPAYFPRLVSRTDGTGTAQFTYVPVGSLGALQVQQEQGPVRQQRHHLGL